MYHSCNCEVSEATMERCIKWVVNKTVVFVVEVSKGFISCNLDHKSFTKLILMTYEPHTVFIDLLFQFCHCSTWFNTLELNKELFQHLLTVILYLREIFNHNSLRFCVFYQQFYFCKYKYILRKKWLIILWINKLTIHYHYIYVYHVFNC